MRPQPRLPPQHRLSTQSLLAALVPPLGPPLRPPSCRCAVGHTQRLSPRPFSAVSPRPPLPLLHPPSFTHRFAHPSSSPLFWVSRHASHILGGSIESSIDGGALPPISLPPRRTRKHPSHPSTDGKKRRVDGRSRGVRGQEWCTPTAIGEYDPVAEARKSVVASRGASSQQKHTSLSKDFEEFSRARGVDPKVVTSVSDAHLANFYHARLRGFVLMESTQKAISAAMTDYFSALKCVGRWQTGRDADGHVTFSGHPNKSDAVDAVKRNHLKALATRGCVVMPVDPFEVGQAAAYYDEHISGSAAIDPEKLGDLCLSLLSMNLLLRFDEASKIKYVFILFALSALFPIISAPMVQRSLTFSY